jgi:hypothetical protein
MLSRNGRLFVLKRNGLLNVYDLSDPARARLGAQLPLGTTGDAPASDKHPAGPLMAVAGDSLVVASGLGLYFVDLSGATGPQVVGRLDVAAPIVTVATSDGYLYAALGGIRVQEQWVPNELLVLDLADPGTPSIVSRSEPLGRLASVAAHGSILYAAIGDTWDDSNAGLWVLRGRESPVRPAVDPGSVTTRRPFPWTRTDPP